LAYGLCEDQRSAFRSDRHPVGERDVAGDLTDMAIWRGEHEKAGAKSPPGKSKPMVLT